MSYLRSVDEPYDRLSPSDDWTVTMSDAEAAARLAPVLAGDLVDMAVVATTPAAGPRSCGPSETLGVRDVDAITIRRLLGLRSMWFSIAMTAGG